MHIKKSLKTDIFFEKIKNSVNKYNPANESPPEPTSHRKPRLTISALTRKQEEMLLLGQKL